MTKKRDGCPSSRKDRQREKKTTPQKTKKPKPGDIITPGEPEINPPPPPSGPSGPTGPGDPIPPGEPGTNPSPNPPPEPTGPGDPISPGEPEAIVGGGNTGD